jgi:serine/threonine protein kinase
MSRRINPFITRRYVPPTEFIGRKQVISNCYQWLARANRTGFMIHGEHGIGKSSLIHYLEHTASQEGWGEPHTRLFFIPLDCQDIRPFTSTIFWHRVLVALRQASNNLELNQKIEELLEESDLDRLTISSELFNALNQHHSSLVLALDGFTWVVDCFADEPDLIGNFLSGLRSLTNQANSPLTVITATREPLAILSAHIVKDYPGSHFYNSFMDQPLGPFSQQEIDSLFVQAEELSDFDFTHDIKDFLVRIAGPHPALLQMAGFHLFEACPDGDLTVQIRRKVIRELEQSAHSYFVQFWDKSSSLERTLFILLILTQLVENKQVQIDLSSATLQELLNKYERDLLRLERRGLAQVEDENYQIASVVFAQWIVRNIAAESEAAFAEQDEAVSDDRLLLVWQAMISLAPQLTLNPAVPMLVQRTAVPSSEKPTVPPRFKIEAEVGRGASSIIYRATDSHLGRTVAIKSLHSHLADGPDVSRHRLLKEAQAASKLQHPHIVTIFDAIEVNDHIWLVMEYLEGRSLADLLKAEDHPDLDQMITWLEQAADALDYAHQQGVIHRDIKPANLMITENGMLKLADFGVAKVLSAPQTTQNGEFKGTVTYMSPEQARSERLDGRSDLFSLGSVAFEMLTGASPWPETGVLGILQSIEEAKARSLIEFDLPGAALLEPVFHKILAKDPEARYQSGKEFVRALKRAITYFGAHGTGKHWALLVGVNIYDDEHHYGRLQSCMHDVQAIRDQLAASGFDLERIHLLTDESLNPPTREHILTTLKSIADNTEPNDLLLFYYSGHGDTMDGESYLVARNSQRLVLSDTGVRVARIKEIIEQAPARAKVIILDACHSGADIKGKKGGAPMSADFLRRVFEQAEGLAIMASCKQGQVSYEWEGLEGSVFTHYLLDALRGQADREEKGFVTVQDVNKHVVDRVKLWASQNNVSQTPTLQYSVAGDIVLAFYN